MDLDLFEDFRKEVDGRESDILEQALISKKDKHNAYSVEREYINSKEYHDKFEKLPVNKDVQESIYRQSGRLLEFVDSMDDEKMSQERLVAISGRTGELIVDNFSRDGETFRTSFDADEKLKIDKCPDTIVLIHNHSLNGRPSGSDLLAYLHNDKLRLSIVVCHDGTVYSIQSVDKKFEDVYNKMLEYKSRLTTDLSEAKRLAMTEMYKLNENLSTKHKLFEIVKL